MKRMVLNENHVYRNKTSFQILVVPQAIIYLKTEVHVYLVHATEISTEESSAHAT